MHKLTRRQNEILQLIKNYIENNGAPPTRAEIANIMGFKSPNAAEDHLRALAKKGIIELLPGTSRGIKLSNHSTGLPIIGQVAAGQPMLSEENVESHYNVDRNLFYPKADYLLRVKGNSMEKAGILDGDLLVVNSTNEANNGQIVVARINNEVTVKRLKKSTESENIIYLLPENDDYSPIEVDLASSQFNIEGIGVGIIRTNF